MDKIYYKELIEKYFDGNITDAEIKELSDWIKNDRHLQNWWEEEFSKSDAGINPVLRDKLFARIKEQTQGKEETQGKEKPRTIRMNPWKWAAAIVLPICIAFFTYYLVDSSQTVGAPFIVKADKGDKATIELPDGTNVVLNSASQLSYLNNFGENVRRVQLNGEAYFKVAHDEKRAFIVQVGDLEVKVLGTSFNVSAYEDAKDVTVVLLEGKVGVYAQKMSHIMKPGDKIEYNKATHKITATQVHPSDYIEWTKGNIYFEKESLENIMKTLSRIYDVEIRFDSNKLPNLSAYSQPHYIFFYFCRTDNQLNRKCYVFTQRVRDPDITKQQ